jgi:hypothetical protein
MAAALRYKLRVFTGERVLMKKFGFGIAVLSMVLSQALAAPPRGTEVEKGKFFLTCDRYAGECMNNGSKQTCAQADMLLEMRDQAPECADEYMLPAACYCVAK